MVLVYTIVLYGSDVKLYRPPKFDDPYKERDYLKGRLAAAFRIFGKVCAALYYFHFHSRGGREGKEDMC